MVEKPGHVRSWMTSTWNHVACRVESPRLKHRHVTYQTVCVFQTVMRPVLVCFPVLCHVILLFVGLPGQGHVTRPGLVCFPGLGHVTRRPARAELLQGRMLVAGVPRVLL